MTNIFNKALENKTSVLFDIVFANSTVLSCFLFSIIDSCFLIPADTAQIFNPAAELVIPIGIPTKEAKAGIEINPITAELIITKCSI